MDKRIDKNVVALHTLIAFGIEYTIKRQLPNMQHKIAISCKTDDKLEWHKLNQYENKLISF